MATTITITGTGFPAPSATRAGPGVLVRSGGFNLQFDVGRSTVQRLVQAGVRPADLDAVFITHHHSDHLVDLPDLVMTRWVVGREPLPPLLTVYPAGPAGRFVERMLDPWEDDLAVRAEHMGAENRPEVALRGFDVVDGVVDVWSGGGVTVSAGLVRHEPVRPAVGYRITTGDGVVAVSGDTRVCDEVAVLAEGADVLIYEAMLFDEIARRPPESQFIMDYHADTRLIGAQAAALGVPKLVLTHLIPEPTTPEMAAAFESTVREGGFDGELIVADDLTSITL